MTAYFQYLLDVNLGLILLYLGYRFFLHKSQHFTGIRFYFLVGVFACFLLPFLEMDAPEWWEPVTLDSSTLNVSVELNPESSIDQTSKPIDSRLFLSDIITIIYTLVTFLFIVHLLFRIVKLCFLIKHSNRIKNESYRVNLSTAKSFTFMRYVILGSEWENLHENAKALVLTHENWHRQQLHSLDILLLQFIQAFCWFNPTVWMLKKSIALNHEFLVDDQMIKDGISINEYSSLLIEQAVPEKENAIIQPFSQSSYLKQRIDMMTEFKSKTHERIIWLAAPILMMMLIASNLTDFNKDGLFKDLESAEKEEFTLFFGEEQINLDEGISKAQLLNNQNETFRLIIRKDFAKNIKLIELMGAKERRAIETLQYGEESLKNNGAEEIRFNLMTTKFTKALQTDGTCRLIILFEYLKPELEQEYYDRLKADKPESEQEYHEGLKIEPKGLVSFVNTDEYLSEKYPDLVERKIYTTRIR
ncbi:MAG: M56 family metallopeptidase [Bacteroidota bacterium]